MKARRSTAKLVDVIQWTGTNQEAVEALLHVQGRAPNVIPQVGHTLLILTHTGSIRAAPDDWIVLDDQGVVSVCPASVFPELYTVVDDTEPLPGEPEAEA